MAKTQSFVRHTAIYGLGALSLQVVGLILLPIHTRYLTPTEFGLLQLLLRVGEVLNIILMFQGIGLATLNFFQLPENDSGQKHIAASANAFLVAIVAIGIGVALLAAAPFAKLLGITGQENILMLGVLCMIAEATVMMPLTLMQARLESTAYVLTTLGIAAIRCTLTFVLVVWLGWGIAGVLLAIGLSYGTIGVGLSVREMARSSFVPSLPQMRAVAKYAWPFFPSGICFFVIRSGDQFLLTKFASLDELAVYGFGNQIARLASMVVIVPVFKVWQTWRYSAFRKANCPKLFGEALTRIAFLYFFVAISLFCFRHEVVLLLGARTYQTATTVVGPLLLAHFFMATANFFDAPFHLLKRTDLKPWIALASTIVIVALYFILIPRYANHGAAYATLFGTLFHAIATYTVAQKVMRIELEWSRIGWLFFTTTLACISISRLDGFAWLPIRISILVLLPVAFWLAGLITPDEKGYLRNLTAQVTSKFGMAS